MAKKMGGIGKRIIITIVLCSLFVTAFVGGISIVENSRILRVNADEKLMLTAQNNNYVVSNIFSQMEQKSSSIRDVAVQTYDINKENDSKFMNEYQANLEKIILDKCKNSKGIVAIYVIFNPEITSKGYQVWYGEKPGSKDFEKMPFTSFDFDEKNPDMQWYFKPYREKKDIWTDPYQDVVSRQPMITYSSPIYVNDKFIGVAAMDINLTSIGEYVGNVKLYDTGYAFVLSSNLDYLVDKKYTFKDNFLKVENGVYKAYGSEMMKNKEGIINFQYNREKIKLCYSRMNNNSILVVRVPEKEILKPVKFFSYLIVLIMVIGMVIAFIVAFYNGKKISKSIKEIKEFVGETAELNLVHKDEDLKANYKDELNHIFKAAANLKGKLRDIINDVKQNSNTILKNSKDVNISASEMVKSMESVSIAVKEISKGALEQSEESQKGLEKLEEVSREIDTVADTYSKVKENSNRSKAAGNNGIEAIEILESKLEVNNQVSDKIGITVENLSEKSKYISEIVDVIQSISNQTNLLALNAAIESARAGEAGKGFAVVSEEIRKLSEQTSNSTKQIATIVSEIQGEILTAKQNVDLSNESIKESDNAMIEAKNAFKYINETIISTINQIDRLSENIAKLAIDKEDVLNSISGISSISEQSATSMEEVSASIEQQTTAINNILISAEKLKNVADNLDKLVSKFKTN